MLVGLIKTCQGTTPNRVLYLGILRNVLELFSRYVAFQHYSTHKNTEESDRSNVPEAINHF